jgi:hypothetical protein
MSLDYNAVESLTETEFQDRMSLSRQSVNFTESDEQDIRRIERLLDIREGTLAGRVHRLESAQCANGHTLTMYDFVFTALIDAGHSKSFIVHTFLGSKFVINEPRPVRCHECGAHTPDPRANLRYSCAPAYGCP